MKPACSFERDKYLSVMGWRACAYCKRLYYEPYIRWSTENVRSPFTCPRCGCEKVCRIEKFSERTVRRLKRRWWLWSWFVERMVRI